MPSDKNGQLWCGTETVFLTNTGDLETFWDLCYTWHTPYKTLKIPAWYILTESGLMYSADCCEHVHG